MRCPHCKKQLQLTGAVQGNISRYAQPLLATTLCCGKGVRVLPRIVYDAVPYIGEKKQDDWNNPFSPTTDEVKNEVLFGDRQRLPA